MNLTPCQNLGPKQASFLIKATSLKIYLLYYKKMFNKKTNIANKKRSASVVHCPK